VDWTFLLALEPVDDTRLVEFAETFQTCQFHPNLILLHADGAFLRKPILTNTVLLRRVKMNHPKWQGVL
jgi:hypothetical protein